MSQADHDAKGRFTRGNKANPGHKLGGRRRTPKGEIRHALKLAEDKMPEIIQDMIQRATGAQDCPSAVRQAAGEYLIDRIYGKANQPFSGAVRNKIIREIIKAPVPDSDDPDNELPQGAEADAIAEADQITGQSDDNTLPGE